MKRFIVRTILPWGITLIALYLAFRGVRWDVLASQLRTLNPAYFSIAVALTCVSYILRAVRWPQLFPRVQLPFASSYKVLVLGFFMNNVLPARAGELVRAHLGSKVTGEPGTLVLATIASERLADGLAISVMFALIILTLGQGHLDPEYAKNLLIVAYLFASVAVGVLLVLSVRGYIFRYTSALETRLDHRAFTYAMKRVRFFIEGLSPLCLPIRALQIAFWSVLIWCVELGVFAAVAAAFGSPLPLSGSVIFLAAVNFSSLIPAAPGGFGVIEFIAKSVLLSLGVASDELALCMALGQHVIQYAVIGIPGAFLMATLRKQLKEMQRLGSSSVIENTSPEATAA